MKVWTDKQGNKLELKEFIERWKQGIENTTPEQHNKGQIFFTKMVIVGLICGIITSFFALKTLWWLIIILVAGLGNTIFQLIALYQQKKMFTWVEEQMKGGKQNE